MCSRCGTTNNKLIVLSVGDLSERLNAHNTITTELVRRFHLAPLLPFRYIIRFVDATSNLR